MKNTILYVIKFTLLLPTAFVGVWLFLQTLYVPESVLQILFNNESISYISGWVLVLVVFSLLFKLSNLMDYLQHKHKYSGELNSDISLYKNGALVYKGHAIFKQNEILENTSLKLVDLTKVTESSRVIFTGGFAIEMKTTEGDEYILTSGRLSASRETNTHINTSLALSSLFGYAVGFGYLINHVIKSKEARKQLKEIITLSKQNNIIDIDRWLRKNVTSFDGVLKYGTMLVLWGLSIILIIGLLGSLLFRIF